MMQSSIGRTGTIITKQRETKRKSPPRSTNRQFFSNKEGFVRERDIVCLSVCPSIHWQHIQYCTYHDPRKTFRKAKQTLVNFSFVCVRSGPGTGTYQVSDQYLNTYQNVDAKYLALLSCNNSYQIRHEWMRSEQ